MVKFVQQVAQPVVKVAADGSLFKKHPRIAQLINVYLANFCPGQRTEVFLADGGSALGSLLLAAAYAAKK